MLRNIERPRHKQLPEIRTMENPDEEFDIDQHLPNVKEAEYLMNPSGYREVCWDLKKRGAVGETIFHLCLLNATSLHADLAKRLLKFYPKLINDIYMSDEYYGKNCVNCFEYYSFHNLCTHTHTLCTLCSTLLRTQFLLFELHGK